VACGPVACIHPSPAGSSIYVHGLLNHPDAPKSLITLICHGLLHLRIAPRVVGHHVEQHPPEFREAEKLLVPELNEAWEWLLRWRWPWLGGRSYGGKVEVLSHWREIWKGLDVPPENNR